MPRINQIQVRRDTAANWTSTNPVLAAGEQGLETDSTRIKFGNGTDTWTALPYASGGGVTSSDTAPSSPIVGDQWFNSLTGKTYVYYDSYWVELDSNGTSATSQGNAIINGAFDIWQRGTTFTNPASDAFTADRFRVFYNGTGASRTVTRQALTPGDIAGYSGQYFTRIDTTVAGSGATFNRLNTLIEDVRTLAGQTATFSFYIKAAANTTVDVAFGQSFGSGGSAFNTTGITTGLAVTTSWQRVSATVTLASVVGKTIGDGSSLQAQIRFPINATHTFDITGVQLEAGTVATPFKRNANSIQGELAACQRYYHRSQSAAPFLIHSTSGIAANATTVGFVVQHPVTMRIGPTSVEFSTLISNDGYSFGSPVTAVTLNQVGPQTALVTATTSGMTTGRFYRLESNNSTAAFIGFSAEL